MPPWPATITQSPQFQSGVAPYPKEMKTMTFALATFRIDGTPTPVLSVDGRHYKLADLAPEVLAPNPAAGLMTVFANWASAEPVLLNAVQRLTDEDVSCDEVPHRGSSRSGSPRCSTPIRSSARARTTTTT